MTKEYKINLALTDSDISELKDGGIKLHFLPTDDVEYISTMCVYNIILKVTPDCMEYNLVNKCVYLSNIIELI